AIADDMPQPRTLVGAWREMRTVWNRQQVEPDYVFDTPLPPTAKPAYIGDTQLREDAADELEASIGDLAPKGLSEKS
ncbi:MAG: hypothetical protein H0X30_32220, partial [Anaerolineae bacterium]|nr:hypothetical protein [Anaerolineae bacterium]